MPDVRPSPIAGQWYEGNPKDLARAVDEHLNAAKLPELDGEVIGVIAPHAGHIYSGAVAGYAFAALKDATPDIVVVVSPMHHPYREPLLTTSHEAYGTPLGDIPVDRTMINELDSMLRSKLGIELSPVSNDPEHSLEIELPFLQRIFQFDWKLLPVMVRAQEPKISEALGRAIASVLQGSKFIIVASTDLSHFYGQQAALKFDRFMLDQMETFDPDALFNAERAGKGYACGLGAVAAVLWACQNLGADRVKVLRHATSGDVTGDLASVVGYGAAAILRG